MITRSQFLGSLAAATLLPALASAGTQYQIRVEGQVEYNAIGSGPLSQVNPGDHATLTFTVDSDLFVNSPSFPVRGYVIDKASYLLQFPGGAVPLEAPYTGNDPLFTIRNNDPAVDGFYISTDVNGPIGVPLDINGSFGPFNHNFYVTYGGDELPSLDIADAVGNYDFTGLTVFNWTIDDGPFNPFGLIFESMSVTEILTGSATVFGCGVNPVGSVAVSGGSPSIGETLLIDVDNPLGTQAPGSLAAAFVAFAPSAAYPCGLTVAGFGMGGPGATGEVLVDTAGPSLFIPGTAWGGAGSPSTVSLAIPDDPVLVGLKAYAQGLIVDPVAAGGVFIGLADAVEITIGS
ncbi:hypothetical protein [Engelhardtia mirabilis]|uniref:PEP-CTERM sorting domain-containing protein n=1 Tax=Engelhardtia mirabilis TaxID=2528011 RepID=A0A518BIY6_9BACT|nr:hypothetical protein Pla133_20080 [Planctomycetes bacterium Pla133]QDV01259.1 hypothetical protein Pla86_20080 [Planctomycetes bacterium Pla86]